MEHFVRVILDEKQEVSFLNESIFPNQNLLETADGRPVFEIVLERELTNEEADEYADRLANYMFEQGYKDFDIEISESTTEQVTEFFDQDNIKDLKIGSELPFNVVEDLCVYMRQDPNFYRTNLYPAMLDVQEAVKNGGKYNKKQMLPVVEKAIIEYIKKFEIQKRPNELLQDSEKMECISKLLKDETESLRKGDY